MQFCQRVLTGITRTKQQHRAGIQRQRTGEAGVDCQRGGLRRGEVESGAALDFIDLLGAGAGGYQVDASLAAAFGGQGLQPAEGHTGQRFGNFHTD